MKATFSRLLIGSALASIPFAAQAQDATAQAAPQTAAEAEAQSASSVGEIIVTAQKRSESINSVGMSITAQSGEQLIEQGVRSVADLAKVVPGFTFEGAAGLAPIYSIRGIGFHDISLASGQTVAVYTDEMPIPFGYETVGVDFDLERVEVLKGPQGTLFGQNSTGGAVNYVLAKPTDNLQVGLDATYGRFNTADVSGFVSGPITDTLKARVAFRVINGGGWQKRYGPVPTNISRHDDDNGRINQFAGRVLLDWRPTDDFKVLLNVNTRREGSETQAPQYINLRPSSSQPIIPEIVAFPYAPDNNRAASWDPGVDYSQENKWFETNVRMDYEVGPATITSLSAYQKYDRNAPNREYDGTPYNALRFGYFGDVETFYQELRAAGDFGGAGSWIVGGNYENDRTREEFFSLNPLGSSRILFGLPNDSNVTNTRNKIDTYGIFANVEYPIVPDVTLQGGIRYTNAVRSQVGCSADSGNGNFARIIEAIQRGLIAAGAKTTPFVPVAPGGCVSLDAQLNPGLFRGRLAEDNISWRAGVNWTASPGFLVYANVSKGYKSGSFPTAAASSHVQFSPVTQEELLAYEAGFKARLAPGVQLNAAGFYYDYTNKQIGGTFIDPILGRLARLVTVPESRVLGFEATLDVRPVEGLTLNTGVSYVDSKIQGTFSNFTPTGVLQSFEGEPFPYAPKWQVNSRAEYKWDIGGDWGAFVGGSVAYQSATNGAFGELPIYRLKAYALVDLRAGVEIGDRYRLWAWGSNVFDTYHWLTTSRNFDADVRNAGQPARYGVSFSFRYR